MNREEQSELQGQEVIKTILRLQKRISERFPGSGLSRVCARLGALAGGTQAELEKLRRPMWTIRAAAVLGILALGAAIGTILHEGAPDSFRMSSLSDFLQALEAAVNLLILLSLSLFFMASLEKRYKRRIALKSLYLLRSIVHIVDMHQLTKDPDFIDGKSAPTASSPARVLGRFEMSRYLDYCSEMFSLTSKVATLYAQHLQDGMVLEAVHDIESLAANLSHKVWQKIMILNLGEGAAAAPR